MSLSGELHQGLKNRDYRYIHVSNQPKHSCLCAVGRNGITQRKAAKTERECVKSIQKGPQFNQDPSLGPSSSKMAAFTSLNFASQLFIILFRWHFSFLNSRVVNFNQALSQDHGRPLSNSSKSLAAVVARLERNAASSCMEGEEDLDEDRLAEEGEDADDEDEDMEAEHQQHHHQQQQQQHLEVDTDCVSGVAAAVVPRVLYEELVHSYRQQEEEMRRLQQELERTRRQLVQQAKKLKEYGSLLTEVKELRDFNRRLQDVLLMRLGSGEGPGAHTHTANH